MKILVTGGAGFVGNALVNKLIDDGHEVTSFDRTKHSGIRLGVNEVYGDLQDSYAVDCYVKEHDYVFNVGGMLGTQETVNNPVPAVHVNILGALNVFNSISRAKIPATHITVGNHWMNNPYSITKSCSERFALMFNKEHNTQITVIRGLNIYGPGQKAFPVKKVIPTFVLSALAGQEVTVYGTGATEMDMIYVSDAAAILASTLNNEYFEDVIDMGTGVAPSVNQIAETVITACESSSKIQHVPMRPGETEFSVVCADTTRLKNNLGFDPEKLISFEEGIVPTIAYYRNNSG